MVDFDLVGLRSGSILHPSGRLSGLRYGLEVFAKLGFLFHASLHAALLSAQLDILRSLLGHLVIDCRVDKLHVSVSLHHPTGSFVGLW